MKNFRKVLALVLVVATLFSFAAMAGAKEYTDSDKIGANYDTAVEVLSALEILNGYTDGSFKPQGAITRAEMAKMIAVLSNAGDDVSELYAAACDFADAKSHWAASYIAYCAQTGVVAGYSATAFGPEDNVTGLQTAKMLLVTMGFDADEQGYTGANWKINVLRDAKNFGLLDGFAAGWNADANITREEAAHMMLNALKAPVIVGTVSENIVKISNAMYNQMPVLTLKDAEHKGFIVLYGNVVVAGDLTLGTALYEGKLKMGLDAVDCYHRPGTTWTLVDNRGLTVLDGKFVADPMATTGYKATDLAAAFKTEEQTLKYTVEVWEDGNLVANTLADANKLLGNGVVYEVYVDDTDTKTADGTVTVIIINTYLGKVTATVKGGTNAVISKFDGETVGAEVACVSNKAYGFKEGDVVLYWLCDEAIHGAPIHNAKVAPVVTATVTRAKADHKVPADSWMIADGKTYYYYNKVEKAGIPEQGKKFDIYTCENGFVMAYATPAEAAPVYEYGYAIAGTGSFEYTTQDANGVWGYKASKDVVDFTATTNTIAVDDTIWTNTLKADQGTLYRYEVIGGVATNAVAADRYTKGVLTSDGTVKDYTGKVRAYALDTSKYLVRTWNYSEGKYQYNAYTAATLPETFLAVGALQVFTSEVGVGNYAGAGKTEVVDYCFIDAMFAQKATKAFVLGTCSYSMTAVEFVKQIGAYDAYEAIIGGVESILLVTSETYGQKPAALARGMYTGSLQVIGLYEDGIPVYANFSGPLKGETLKETIEFIGGKLIYNEIARPIATDAKIIVIDEINNDVIFLTGAEQLNDYVESQAGWDEAGSHNPTPDTCYGYNFDEAWFTPESGTVTELIVTLKTVPTPIVEVN